MPRVLLVLVGLVVVGACVLQLRHQRLQLRHETARLHRELQREQAQLWRQQLEIATYAAPQVVGRIADE